MVHWFWCCNASPLIRGSCLLRGYPPFYEENPFGIYQKALRHSTFSMWCHDCSLFEATATFCFACSSTYSKGSGLSEVSHRALDLCSLCGAFLLQPFATVRDRPSVALTHTPAHMLRFRPEVSHGRRNKCEIMLEVLHVMILWLAQHLEDVSADVHSLLGKSWQGQYTSKDFRCVCVISRIGRQGCFSRVLLHGALQGSCKGWRHLQACSKSAFYKSLTKTRRPCVF